MKNKLNLTDILSDKIPLYLSGYSYASEENAIEAWKSGKDFYMINNQYGYCSIRDKSAILEEYDGIIILLANHYKIKVA